MRLLLLYPRVPFPPNKGDKIRTFHQLAYLTARHEVWCACFVDDLRDWCWIAEVERRCTRLAAIDLTPGVRTRRGVAALLRGRSVTESVYDDARMREVIGRWSGEGAFDAVLSFGSGMGPLGLRARARRRVIDLCDLDSAKWGEYGRRRGRARGWLYAREAKHIARLERELAEQYDATVLVTGEEARAAIAWGAAAAKVVVVGNGVRLDGEQLAPAREPVAVFVGALDYWPNADGVCWFAEEVWPEVRRRVPGAEWRIVGRGAPQRVRALNRREGIRVVGEVEEVGPWLCGARVVVSPLRVARGVQNKVLEGMAAGRAVVATPAAAEGIAAKSGAGLRIAATADEQAEAVVEYLARAGVAEREGAAAREFVAEHFAWEEKLAALERLLIGDGGEREESRGAADAARGVRERIARGAMRATAEVRAQEDEAAREVVGERA